VGQAFELPPEAPRRFSAHSPWKQDRDAPALSLTAEQNHIFVLQPFEVLTFEAVPIHQ
jgi:hypothetical protein